MKRSMQIALSIMALIISSVAVAQVAPPAGAGALNASASGKATDRFIKNVSQADNTEMIAAQYALANSQNPQVKLFAQQMLTDHGKAERQLKDIAARKGITLPTDIDLQQKAVADQLQQENGAKFDTAYAKAMVKDHQEAVALFKRTAQNPQIDAEVRQFAQQRLPKLQDQLTMANRLLDATSGAKVSSGAPPAPADR